MLANEAQLLLSRLRAGVKQHVSLRCSCENLETVYIHLDDQGNLRVDDDHETFRYLYEANNCTYVPLKALDLDLIREIFRELRVVWVDAPPDGYPGIECRIGPEQPIANAVERVAKAIDRVFFMARRPDLK